MTMNSERDVREVVAEFEMPHRDRAREVIAEYEDGTRRNEIEVAVNGRYTPMFRELVVNES